MTAALVGVAVAVALFLILDRITRPKPPAFTGEQCEVCGQALTVDTQVEVREDQAGDPAAAEIAAMGGGSYLAAYYCTTHAPSATMAA